MLVISRKQEESVIIELEEGCEPIEIKVISIDNQVKLGIIAPRGCKIWRDELYKTVELNRQAAENSAVGNLRNLRTQIASEKE